MHLKEGTTLNNVWVFFYHIRLELSDCDSILFVTLVGWGGVQCLRSKNESYQMACEALF